MYFVTSLLFKINNASWRFFSLRDALKLELVLFSSMLSSFLFSFTLDQYFQISTSAALLLLTMRGIRKITFDSKKNITDSSNILIIGKVNHVNLARSLEREGHNVMGFIDNDDNGLRKSSFPVLGQFSDLENILEDRKIQTVALSDEIQGEKLRAVMQACTTLKVELKKYSYQTNLNSWKLKEFDLHELLGRSRVKVNLDSLHSELFDKVVLVTGAGGSIGSELSRQLAKYSLDKLILLDSSEYNLFTIKNELHKRYPKLDIFTAVMTDIKDFKSLENVFEKHRPHRVYHAAAYKHVYLVEQNPFSAILNNVMGTQNLLKLSSRYDIENFLLVSTDKAVNPTSVMGATKRICELLVCKEALKNKGIYSSVRFGNVLGSSGSLIPILKDQIANDGPVTITDPDMRRFFMSIPEAVSLVLKSSSLANNGAVNILKMGDEIKIVDIAKKLIALCGRNEKQIPIVFTGKKPGEKLYEELYLCGNELETQHSDIVTLPHGDCLNLFSSEEGRFKFDQSVSQMINLAQEFDILSLEVLQLMINQSNRVVDTDNQFEVQLGRSA